jgi:hypothetical protein
MNKLLKTITLTIVIGASSLTSLNAKNPSALFAGLKTAISTKAANLSTAVKNNAVSKALSKAQEVTRTAVYKASGLVGIYTGIGLGLAYDNHLNANNPEKANTLITRELVTGVSLFSLGSIMKYFKTASPALPFGKALAITAALTPAFVLTKNTLLDVKDKGLEKTGLGIIADLGNTATETWKDVQSLTETKSK